MSVLPAPPQKSSDTESKTHPSPQAHQPSSGPHGTSGSKPRSKITKDLMMIGVEMILPLVFLSILSVIFYQGHRFRSISPHPFWIVLLPVVVQYGTQKGFLCAFLCSLFLLVGNIPPRAIDQNLYVYYFSVMHNPLLWFVTSFILGELRVRHIQESKDLAQKVLQIQEENHILEKAFRNLKKIKENLEIRMASHWLTPSTPLRAIGRLIESSPGQVIENFIKAVEDLIEPKAYSIYARENQVLKVVHAYGWPTNPPEDSTAPLKTSRPETSKSPESPESPETPETLKNPDREPLETSQTPGHSHSSYGSRDMAPSYNKIFPPSSSLFQWIVQHKKEACVIDKIGEKVLNHQGVYALPLIDPRTEEVFGMLKIEKIAFENLNLSTLETIRALTKCACRAYALSLDVLKAHSLSSAS